MKKKNITDHESQCFICHDMARRGYRKEELYWEGKLRKVKYKLMYKGKVYKGENLWSAEDYLSTKPIKS